MAARAGYEVVIPYYDDEGSLKELFEDIHTTVRRTFPRRILVIDDGSNNPPDYACKFYQSGSLSIIVLKRPHLGELEAVRHGLLKVETDYAMVMHSDTKLAGNFGYLDAKIYQDSMSWLYYCISHTSYTSAVSLHSLCLERPMRLIGGARGIGFNGVPYSYLRDYHPNPIFANVYDEWAEAVSCDSYMVAMKMDVYRKVGFRKRYGPYKYFWDDYFMRAREEKKHLFITQKVVAFHPKFKEKPQGSKSLLTSDDYSRIHKAFTEDMEEKRFFYSRESFYGVEGDEIVPFSHNVPI